jgi:hypothetical protein
MIVHRRFGGKCHLIAAPSCEASLDFCSIKRHYHAEYLTLHCWPTFRRKLPPYCDNIYRFRGDKKLTLISINGSVGCKAVYMIVHRRFGGKCHLIAASSCEASLDFCSIKRHYHAEYLTLHCWPTFRRKLPPYLDTLLQKPAEFHCNMRYYNLKYRTFHNHHCKNLKCDMRHEVLAVQLTIATTKHGPVWTTANAAELTRLHCCKGLVIHWHYEYTYVSGCTGS